MLSLLRPNSLLLALALFAAPLHASQEALLAPPLPAGLAAPERALLEESYSGDQSGAYIRLITSRFPRRLTGSQGLREAQAWALQTFEELGLEAHLESWGEVPVGFDRGESRGRQVAPVERELRFTTPAWSPGTDGAVRAAALLEAASVEEARELGDALSGVWVVRNPKVRGRARRELEALYEERGSLGVVGPGARDGRLVTGGSWDVDHAALPRLVRVVVDYEQHSSLVESLRDGAAIELEFDIAAEFQQGPVEQHNVIADLRGSEFPDEYVLVQGHIDGWDGAEGACDNGTGVATTLEAARLLSQLGVAPRRTIRFVLYSGEEQGLFGSRGYVKTHADELERTSIVLNHDNGTNYLRGIGPTSAMLADFEEVFAPIQELDAERPFELRVSPGLTPGPSDHAPFIEAGVPAFHWDQSEEGYRRLHHTQHDTLAEVNDADQRHSSRVVALAAWRFAALDHLVDRTRMRQPSPRRMGVYLNQDDGCLVDSVVEGSLASAAGWKAGDRILAIDEQAVSSRGEIQEALQRGGPRKLVRLERGGEELETVLDYSDDPLERERQEWRDGE